MKIITIKGNIIIIPINAIIQSKRCFMNNDDFFKLLFLIINCRFAARIN